MHRPVVAVPVAQIVAACRIGQPPGRSPERRSGEPVLAIAPQALLGERLAEVVLALQAGLKDRLRLHCPAPAAERDDQLVRRHPLAIAADEVRVELGEAHHPAEQHERGDRALGYGGADPAADALQHPVAREDLLVIRIDQPAHTAIRALLERSHRQAVAQRRLLAQELEGRHLGVAQRHGGNATAAVQRLLHAGLQPLHLIEEAGRKRAVARRDQGADIQHRLNIEDRDQGGARAGLETNLLDTVPGPLRLAPAVGEHGPALARGVVAGLLHPLRQLGHEHAGSLPAPFVRTVSPDRRRQPPQRCIDGLLHVREHLAVALRGGAGLPVENAPVIGEPHGQVTAPFGPLELH